MDQTISELDGMIGVYPEIKFSSHPNREVDNRAHYLRSDAGLLHSQGQF